MLSNPKLFPIQQNPNYSQFFCIGNKTVECKKRKCVEEAQKLDTNLNKIGELSMLSLSIHSYVLQCMSL